MTGFTKLPAVAASEEKIREIVYPRFSTHNFENARTRSGHRYGIHTLDYESGKKGFPSMARGYVYIGTSFKNMEWDRHGRAFSQEGIRQINFDLIREDKQDVREIDSVRPFAIAILCIIILIAILGI